MTGWVGKEKGRWTKEDEQKKEIKLFVVKDPGERE
jgi:hypothetical protein